MIGFEIPKSDWESANYCVVYIGKTNPFEIGKMKPIIWEETKNLNFPISETSKEFKEALQYRKCELIKTYMYKLDSLKYFVQDYSNKNEVEIRHIIVINEKQKTIILNDELINSEGKSNNAINYEYDKWPEQFTGILFKNISPVLFGFESYSFSCRGLYILNSKKSVIGINCDCRH
jgi:hypothetical protein